MKTAATEPPFFIPVFSFLLSLPCLTANLQSIFCNAIAASTIFCLLCNSLRHRSAINTALMAPLLLHGNNELLQS